MSYQQELTRSFLASPVGMCLATQTLNQTPSVGGTISFNGFLEMSGTLHLDLSLSSGSLVLPQGYWYYIEASVQFLITGTLPGNFPSAYAKVSLYEGASKVGTQGHNAMQQSGKDSALFSADEKSIALVDATSAQKTITLKLDDIYIFNSVNNTTDPQYVYGGQGRALVVQLEGAP